MFFRRALIPIFLALVFLVQFVPGTGLGPKPAAAMVTCTNLAQFVADVTIPDGTTVSPGSTFTKTWRLKNAGTCTWSTSYAVQFISGTNMAASSTLPMPSSIAPGATVDITTSMTAPAAPGHYRGNYELKSDTGTLFGVGANAAFLFWVDINVGTTLTSAYDFVANAASATWSSGAGALTFPGTDGNVNGFALPAANPQLENGTTSSTAGIIVNPQQVTGGFIQGKYPAFTVQAGDRFQSIVNCAFNATKCYVNFRLAYQIGTGPVTTLWSFNERYEGLFFRANVDLSSLAGKSVNFILYVADVPAHGTPSGDRAEWVGTMIARGGGGGTPIPPPSTCNLGSFVGDVTIPDGTVMPPGQVFTKTWRIRNVGSCSWTNAYKLVFVFGNGGTFGATSPTAFSPTSVSVLPVAPGQTADFSLNMVAPTIPGHYRSFWRFQNDTGQQFGVGSGMVTFFADINVSGTAPTLTPGGPTPTQIITGPSADVSVTKTDNVTSYTPGGTLNYTIVVQNNGPLAVTGATFTDNKPSPHVTSWTWTCTGDAGTLCNAGPTTSSLNVSDTINLPVGAKITYNVVANVNPSAVGPLVNTASVSLPGSIQDPNLANNSATDTDAPPNADLGVTMTDNVDMYTLGGSIIYTIQLSNAGPLAAIGANFSDMKPSQITSWTWVCTTTGGAVWSGPGTTTGNVSATVNMPAGSTISCTVTASISSSATGNLVNTANITPPSGIFDAVTTNNSASTTAIGPSADLAVTKTDGVTFYMPGGTLTYTIVVHNNGPLIANAATFTDLKPAQITSWTWTCVADTGASCFLGLLSPFVTSGDFTDTVTIPNGNSVTYKVVATINAAATGNLVNTANVNPALGGIPDLNPANNSFTDTDAPPSADLQVTKTDNLTIYPPGGTVTYQIVVKNNGPQAVTNVPFTDNLPVNVASWVWSCVADTDATCLSGGSLTNPPSVLAGNATDLITLPVGGKVTYTVVATVVAAATGDITNTASVGVPAGFNDPNLVNNTATDVDAHPTADLAVTINDQVGTVKAGSPTIYTVVITNAGPSNVNAATVTAAFPGVLVTNWTWACTQVSFGGLCTPSTGPNNLPFTDTVNIPAGGSITYTVTTNITPAVTGTLLVNVIITAPSVAPNDVTDPVPGNNFSTDTDSVVLP